MKYMFLEILSIPFTITDKRHDDADRCVNFIFTSDSVFPTFKKKAILPNVLGSEPLVDLIASVGLEAFPIKDARQPELASELAAVRQL